MDNFEGKCFICLSTEGNNVLSSEMKYIMCLFACCNVSLFDNVNIPKRICSHCNKQMIITIQFLQKVKHSIQKFNHYLNTMNCIEGDIKIDTVNYDDVHSESEVHYSMQQIHSGNDPKNRNTKYISNEQKKCDISKIKCFRCSLYFNKIGNLNKHNEEKHSVEQKSNFVKDSTNSMKCIVSKESLMYKVIKNKEPGVKKNLLECLICGQVVTSKSVFTVHYRKHSGERPYSCHICQKSFTQMGTLNDHVKVKHLILQDGNVNKFICDMCGKNFLKKGHLITHIRTHSTEKSIVCQYCPQKFRSYHVRSVHIRVHHTKDKPYMCHICGKSVTSVTELKSHMMRHSDERKFKCSTCNLAVKSLCNLKKHVLRKHSDKRNHICDICSANYAVKYNLMEHIKNKHPSYYCDVCKKVFSDLESHKQSHLKDEV